MDVPAEYQGGREQTFFKHQVLMHYLRAWSQKLASVGRTGRRVRLWYVDCFAGPWESRTETRADTSVAIGLRALGEALGTRAGAPAKVEAGAIFVESNAASARALREFVADQQEKHGLEPHVLEGEFAARSDDIKRLIGNDAAFIFVDPTGWKGVGMRHIAPLVASRYRDVMVNVMFHHLNRWKDDRREFLRLQMREFFGLGQADLPGDLDEEGLMGLYRRQLKEHARLSHVADLAVPHPTVDRTFFRLVVGGHHPEVVHLFRNIEEKVVGRDAGPVRENAKTRARERRTGQHEPQFGMMASIDVRYREMRDQGLALALRVIRERLVVEGAMPFGKIWPSLLEVHHFTRKHLADAVMADVPATGGLVVQGMKARERAVKDEHIIAASTEGSGRHA